MLKVGLFVTCLVDLFRPSVGFATIKLLQESGCIVDVPIQQTCCGQPAYNSGDRSSAISAAKNTIITYENYDYVVVPSGSCASMLIKHYPQLLQNDKVYKEKADTLATKTFELTSFLYDVIGLRKIPRSFPHHVTYHDACSGLRELGIKKQPRELLNSLQGIKLVEHDASNVCCGFGGTFCVKYPEISEDMVKNKTESIVRSGADMILSGDMGCLLNIAGKIAREKNDIEVRHIAEVMAGKTDVSGIGDTKEPIKSKVSKK